MPTIPICSLTAAGYSLSVFKMPLEVRADASFSAASSPLSLGRLVGGVELSQRQVVV